jgi:hypothetical protein
VKTSSLVYCIGDRVVYLQLEKGIDGLGAIVYDICMYALYVTQYSILN